MSTIRSGSRAQPVSFKGDYLRSSFAILLTDSIRDASWRLRIECKTEDGGYFVLGAVDTLPVNALVVKSPNRIVAVCSVPGVKEWLVYAELLAGTPSPGKTTVEAEMKFTAAEEYAAGCCPLVAVPGNSVNVNLTNDQTDTGGPPVAPRITFYTGSGFALAADVAYLGLGLVGIGPWVQLHDAGATDPISTATMLSIGYPFAPPVTQTILLQWEPGRRFLRGFTVALSLAQMTFLPSIESIGATGQWSRSHD